MKLHKKNYWMHKLNFHFTPKIVFGLLLMNYRYGRGNLILYLCWFLMGCLDMLLVRRREIRIRGKLVNPWLMIRMLMIICIKKRSMEVLELGLVLLNKITTIITVVVIRSKLIIRWGLRCRRLGLMIKIICRSPGNSMNSQLKIFIGNNSLRCSSEHTQI